MPGFVRGLITDAEVRLWDDEWKAVGLPHEASIVTFDYTIDNERSYRDVGRVTWGERDVSDAPS